MIKIYFKEHQHGGYDVWCMCSINNASISWQGLRAISRDGSAIVRGAVNFLLYWFMVHARTIVCHAGLVDVIILQKKHPCLVNDCLLACVFV